MRRTNALEQRITALEGTVRVLRDRLERAESHLTVTQDEQVARVLARHPDLRKHLPRVG